MKTSKITIRIFGSIATSKIQLLSIILYLIIILPSCNNSHVYIISQEDSLLKASHTDSLGFVLTPPNAKYAQYTFIVDSNDHVFFYSMPKGRQVKGVMDDHEPDSLGLMSNHIFAIPKMTEESFFEENVLKKKSSLRIEHIMFASFKDTITTGFLKYLKDMSDDKQNKLSVNIRLALPEERKVIKSLIDTSKRILNPKDLNHK